MESVKEIAVTSCLNDPVMSVYVWDAWTGTSLMTYRGDVAVCAGAVSLLSAQYVVAALQNKPFLRVWPVNSQQSLTTVRLVCPGCVTIAQVSPDNCYIAVTVSEKIYIYQMATGYLVGTGSRHYQPVTVVRWSADGSIIACGGEDSLVTVWSLSTLSSTQSPVPRLALSDHSLPVTDLSLTLARLISVSADRTCKVYDLYQGVLLMSLVFEEILTSVTTSVLETRLFVGTEKGNILQFNLLSPPRHLEYHLSSEERDPAFTGHSKSINCLDTSINGDLLMSGSSDGDVKIWHINSYQCLRTIKHKGPITNAFFAPTPKQILASDLKSSVTISSFQTASTDQSNYVEVMTDKTLHLCDNYVQKVSYKQESDSCNEQVKSLQMEIDLLRSINSNLYKFTVDNILKNKDLQPCAPPQQNKGKVSLKTTGNESKRTLKEMIPKNTCNSKLLTVNGVTKKKRKKRNKVKK